MNQPRYNIGQIVFVPECENRIFMGSFKKITSTTIVSFFSYEEPKNQMQNGTFYNLKGFTGPYLENEFFLSWEEAEKAMEIVFNQKSCIE
ncbi:MAG: hypothetical protein AABY22_06860 [Nanoarchaeota archaeon]